MKSEKEIKEEIDKAVQELIINTNNVRRINELQARLKALFWVIGE